MLILIQRILTYAAKVCLMARRDTETGLIKWTPISGKPISDGQLSATTPVVIRTTMAPQLPTVVMVPTRHAQFPTGHAAARGSGRRRYQA